MIEVEVHYYNRAVKYHKTNDFFIYTYFRVKGHANNGTSEDCLRVCAGVSACVIGLNRILDREQFDIKYEKGLFEVKLKTGKVNDDTFVDKDSCYGLNTLLCQLYDLNVMYPAQFLKFDMIEEKEIENYYANERKENSPKTKPRAKPFRELKRERNH